MHYNARDDGPPVLDRQSAPYGLLKMSSFDRDGWEERARRQRAATLRSMAPSLRVHRNAPGASVVSLPVVFVPVALASVAMVVLYSRLLSLAGMPTTALALMAVMVASTISSIAGFAFSPICGAILLQIMNDPVQVVEILMICSIANQSLCVAVLWRNIDWRAISPFLLGGLLGLPFGVFLLLHIGQLWIKDAIGALTACYSIYALLNRTPTVAGQNTSLDAAIGFVGGITGGLAGFPGAPVTIWCGLKGMGKQRQRGIFQPFILLMQLTALALIQVMQSHTQQTASLHFHPLPFVPVALIGTWFGLTIFRRMSDPSFALVVKLLLLVSGIGLLL
jgi:uncharacterized protein